MTTNQGSREELRLALVMNGGVSLAVWIGGVTLEIGRLLAGHPAYEGLCDIAETAPRVDVIAGTSAGGINGAYLALCIAHLKGPALLTHLDKLRNLWIDNGSFDSLLRGPFSRTPPSLLDGDGYFLPLLRRALQDVPLAPRDPGSAPPPLELIITTTLLHGEDTGKTDDFGVKIADVSHRGTLHFSSRRRNKTTGTETDDFADARIADRLALAARCTSSFPAAFEPSFCPVKPDAETADRPSLETIANFKTSGFVLDGGLLDNKPLDLALQEIFRQRAVEPVRRVLAYVVPDPGATATPKADAGKPPPDPPDLLSVLMASTVQIPGVQSVSAQIDALREHNQRVRDRRHARVLLTRYSDPATIDAMSSGLFAAYQAQRLETASTYVTNTMEKKLIENGGLGFRSRGRREWIQAFICKQRAGLPWMPQHAPVSPEAAAERTRDGWRWGTRPVEHSVRLLLDIVQRCQGLVRLLPGAVIPSLAAQSETTFDLLDRTSQFRGDDDALWSAQGAKVAEMLGGGSAARAPDDAARQWLGGLIQDWRGSAAKSADAMQEIASVLLSMRPHIAALAAAIPARQSSPGAGDLLRQEERELWASLSTLYGYFVRGDPAQDTQDAVVARLLAFEVVQEALGGWGTIAEEEINFIQISGDGKCGFDGPGQAADKLAGVQLAHFGAFYKESWRANDWMWGRLDAVRRLVRVLLDPERLRVVSLSKPLGGRAAWAAGAIEQVALGADPEAVAVLEPLFDRGRLAAELRYLDDPALLVPEYLDQAVTAVSRRIELDILREELPKVARALDLDAEVGAHPSAAAVRFRKEVAANMAGGLAAAGQVGNLLAKCAIGQERLDAEIGTDRLTRVAAQTATLTVAAVSQQRGWLVSLGRTLALLRTPTLLLYLFARNAQYSSRSADAASVAAMVLGATIVVTAILGRVPYSTPVLALAWAALVAGGLFSLSKLPGRLRLAVPAVVAALVVVVLIVCPALMDKAMQWFARASPGIALVESVLLAALVFGWTPLARVMVRRQAKAADPAQSPAAPPAPRPGGPAR